MSKPEWPSNDAELNALLIKRRGRYEQLVYNMSDVLLLLEPDGTVAFSNRPPAPGFGPGAYPPVGTSALEAILEADRPAVVRAVEDIAAGRTRNREVLFRVPAGGGEEHTIEGTLTPIVEAGRVAQVEFLGRDVTERHRAAEALRQANDALRRRQAELDRDLAVASTIHTSLLPGPMTTDRVLIDVKHIPLLGVGGDYLYIHRQDPLRPAVAVFDVAGHGIASALVANRVHSAVYTILNQGSAPSEMIRRLNRFIYDSFSDLGLFVTLFVMRMDLPAGSVCYCGAGHPPALLRKGRTGQVRRLESQHLPVGAAKEVFMGQPEEYADIAPGELIWVYTDGLMELQDAQERMLGVRGLIRRLGDVDASAARPGLAEERLGAILADHAVPQDDLTLVAAAVR